MSYTVDHHDKNILSYHHRIDISSYHTVHTRVHTRVHTCTPNIKYFFNVFIEFVLNVEY